MQLMYRREAFKRSMQRATELVNEDPELRVLMESVIASIKEACDKGLVSVYIQDWIEPKLEHKNVIMLVLRNRGYSVSDTTTSMTIEWPTGEVD